MKDTSKFGIICINNHRHDLYISIVEHRYEHHLVISSQKQNSEPILSSIFRACALAILDRENWRKAMRSRSVERGVTTTPLRKMIVKEPGEFFPPRKVVKESVK
jgi:hypothetical protein